MPLAVRLSGMLGGALFAGDVLITPARR
jgi:K+ transporter